jgi:hypothetical protein
MGIQTLPLPVSGLEQRMHLPAGTITGADSDAAEMAIADATALAIILIPTNVGAGWEANGVPDAVAMCIYKAARREFENPSGLSQEIAGEHTITTSATSGVFFTPLETSVIKKAAGYTTSGFVGTVRTPSAHPVNYPWWW